MDRPVDDFEGRSTGSARVLAFLLSGWSVDPAQSIAGEALVDDHRPAKMKIALGFLGRSFHDSIDQVDRPGAVFLPKLYKPVHVQN